MTNIRYASKTKSNAQKIHIKSYSLKKQPIATGALVEICFALDLRAFSTGHPSVICDQCNFPLSPFSMEAHSKKIATCIQVAIFICETIVIEFMLFIRIFIFNIWSNFHFLCWLKSSVQNKHRHTSGNFSSVGKSWEISGGNFYPRYNHERFHVVHQDFPLQLLTKLSLSFLVKSWRSNKKETHKWQFFIRGIIVRDFTSFITTSFFNLVSD